MDEGLLAMEALNLFKADSQQNPTVSPSSLSANRLGSIGRPGFIGQSVLIGVQILFWPSTSPAAAFGTSSESEVVTISALSDRWLKLPVSRWHFLLLNSVQWVFKHG